jgi:branched-chain amino acid transport system ATP-binding protein
MLRIENLRAAYGRVEVLHGVHLHVPQAAVVALIGPNGAGKSTLLRAISGLVTPEVGRITLAGQRIDGLATHEIARLGVAHVPQGRHVFPGMSVADNLRLGAFRRLGPPWCRDAAVRADLEVVLGLFPRLKERLRQLAGTLSGGEQQMLAMARAMMLNPSVLLLDEPSMGLSPKGVEEVFSIIEQLRTRKVTMLLVEQFAATALLVADHGCVMENGRITLQDRAQALRHDPAVQAAYLGVRR